MTLEEAILHCEEVAICAKGSCADEHRQLAEWLKELRERRAKNKPIEYTELCFFCNQKGTDHCNECSVRRAYEKIAEDDDNYIEPQTEVSAQEYERWLFKEPKDEPKICNTCRYYNTNIPCGSTPSACKEADKFAEEFVDGLKKLKSKDEPQTEGGSK